MNGLNRADLDNYITGHYGEDQFKRFNKVNGPSRKDLLIEAVMAECEEHGHWPHPWVRGKSGYHTSCQYCGGVYRINLSKNSIVVRPTHPCSRREKESLNEADTVADDANREMGLPEGEDWGNK